MQKIKKYFALIIRIFFFGFIVCTAILLWNIFNSAGWVYSFKNPVATHKTLPKIFHSLTFNNISLFYSGLDNVMTSIDIRTGLLRWRHNEQSYSIYLSEFDKNNQLFLTNFDGNLYSLDKHTGNELWRFTTPDRTKIDTEPVVTDQDVLFGSRNGTLYAVNKITGSLHWTYTTKQIDTSYYKSDEIILHFGRFATDDATVYLNSATENRLIAIDLGTGKKIWDVPLHNYFFSKPSIFHKTIGYWDDSNTYKLLNKISGETLLEISSSDNSLQVGVSCIYVIRDDNAIECIDANTAKQEWTYNNSYNSPLGITEATKDFALVTYSNINATILVALDTKHGVELWSHSFSNIQNFSYQIIDKNIVIVGQTIQCSLSFSGDVHWCTNKKIDTVATKANKRGVFIISKADKSTVVSFQNHLNGDMLWQYTSDDIDIDSIQSFNQDIFFLNKENTSITSLNSDFLHGNITKRNLINISYINELISRIHYLIHEANSKLQLLKITIEQPQKFVLKNGIFELILKSNKEKGDQLNTEYSIVLTSPINKEYTIKAFYYDIKTWKLRFSPDTVGIWKWRFLSNSIFETKQERGSFLVTESNNPGYIYLSKINKKYFASSNGNIFLPIGIQNCVNDLHHDGNPLNAWPLDDEVKGSDDDSFYKTTTVEDYLATYADSGFNTYRWGAGNCSFMLWNFGKSGNIGPKVNEGILLDSILSTLKKNRYHTWMSLMSFELPYGSDIPLTDQKKQLQNYLDYIVSRYGAYVDVWELANEIKLSDDLIHYMAAYIRAIDPYKHPITTSWERPDLSDIEATSYHWYSGECNEYCDQDLAREVDKFVKYDKPMIFSEQGNNFANWDIFSPIRYRIRLWLSFFRQASIISWNMPNVYFENKTGPSNVYLGPIERSYASIFSTYIADIGTDIQKYDITSNNKKHKVFSVISADIIYGYVYTKIFNPEKNRATLSLEVHKDGTIYWINPENGEIILHQQVIKGKMDIQTPMFTTDLLFIIK